MNWTKRQERIRLDIIKDLVKFDLLTCRPISDHRQTARITAILPDDPTLLDLDCTSVSFFDATTTRMEALSS
jgi:hypothetical protein